MGVRFFGFHITQLVVNTGTIGVVCYGNPPGTLISLPLIVQTAELNLINSSSGSPSSNMFNAAGIGNPVYNISNEESKI